MGVKLKKNDINRQKRYCMIAMGELDDESLKVLWTAGVYIPFPKQTHLHPPPTVSCGSVYLDPAKIAREDMIDSNRFVK